MVDFLEQIFTTPWWPARRTTPGTSIECVKRLHAMATNGQLAADMVVQLDIFCDGFCLICVREGKDLLKIAFLPQAEVENLLTNSKIPSHQTPAQPD
ncbi:hypothetical protein AC578_4873 [Pseudocercospora eumusae]|uniref:Uncharacterized protein n=1 Tax=Pseudocercospora eumusae TaxID=321146 RepID=A0A139HC80_9PEZI|nr:hypothetical protein AC578_4873 [Pseudocercospora eumusae]